MKRPPIVIPDQRTQRQTASTSTSPAPLAKASCIHTHETVNVNNCQPSTCSRTQYSHSDLHAPSPTSPSATHRNISTLPATPTLESELGALSPRDIRPPENRKARDAKLSQSSQPSENMGDDPPDDEDDQSSDEGGHMNNEDVHVRNTLQASRSLGLQRPTLATHSPPAISFQYNVDACVQNIGTPSTDERYLSIMPSSKNMISTNTFTATHAHALE